MRPRVVSTGAKRTLAAAPRSETPDRPLRVGTDAPLLLGDGFHDGDGDGDVLHGHAGGVEHGDLLG
jgi:hypothetical protein